MESYTIEHLAAGKALCSEGLLLSNLASSSFQSQVLLLNTPFVTLALPRWLLLTIVIRPGISLFHHLNICNWLNKLGMVRLSRTTVLESREDLGNLKPHHPTHVLQSSALEGIRHWRTECSFGFSCLSFPWQETSDKRLGKTVALKSNQWQWQKFQTTYY